MKGEYDARPQSSKSVGVECNNLCYSFARATGMFNWYELSRRNTFK